tara:strand:- start:1369 stop:2442 length:1074 start_codon:yes stop_codon:yes gene_type:complete
MKFDNDVEHMISLIKNNTTLIDLRAPIEFNKGAFPSSVNIPILNNEQRASIGIKYKSEGGQAAEKLGFKLVKDQKNELVSSWKKIIKKDQDTHIYCMRGGRRSQIAQLWLNDEGINVPFIEGGYKTLRQSCIEILNSVKDDQKEWIILAGRTGTGKTAILKDLNSAIDLEGHALHRGSAFGGLAEEQPTVINFENNLASEYIKHDSKILFLEDECRRIGKLSIPNAWYEKMERAKIVIIELDIEERISNIAKEYVYRPLENGLAKNKLNEILLSSLYKIHKRLGLKLYNQISMKIQSILINQNKSSHEEWIKDLLVNYYDPMYDYQLEAKKNRCMLNGSKSKVINYLNEIETNQSLQ